MMAWHDRGTPSASQGASTNNCQPSRGQTLASSGPKTPIFGTNHLGGGIRPNPNSYHALTTNACQSHFLLPLSRNIDPVIHASSIHGCAPADTLICQLVTLKSICGLYTSCVSTARFKMKYVRPAHFRKCHSIRRVAPINHKRAMYVLLSQGGRVGEKKERDKQREVQN